MTLEEEGRGNSFSTKKKKKPNIMEEVSFSKNTNEK